MRWMPQDLLMERAKRAAHDVSVDRGFEVRTASAKWSGCDVPVIINNFNRLDYLRQLVDSLRTRGYENLYIIDNASNFEPLLDYYGEADLRVFRLSRNVGYLALWATPVFDAFRDTHYVYTDADVVPDTGCPNDFMDLFKEGLDRLPGVGKVGFGLRIDDLPDGYPMKNAVLTHESELRRGRPVTRSFYRASIDTTFALYRPGVEGGSWIRSLRTNEPYVARHLPWYEVPGPADPERMNYLSVVRTATHWASRSGETTHDVLLEGHIVHVASGRGDDAWNDAARGEWRPEVLEAMDSLLPEGGRYVEYGDSPGQAALYAAFTGHMATAVRFDDERADELSETVQLNESLGGRLVVETPASIGCTVLPACEAVSKAEFVAVDLTAPPVALVRRIRRCAGTARPTICVTLRPGARRGLKTGSLLGRAAVAGLLLVEYARMKRCLSGYRHVYVAPATEASLAWVLLHLRSRLTLVATDREWAATGRRVV